MSDNKCTINVSPLLVATAVLAYQGRNARVNSLWEYFWPIAIGLSLPLGLIAISVWLMN